ncbi:MAG: T9SS type A sorting domain-containing protein [Bacteroidia bacterium]
MSKRIATLLILALTSFLYGQTPQIEVSGITYQGVGSAPDTFRVYLQSLTGQNISVRSATLSVLHNSSCSSYGGMYFSLFRNIWAGFFESVQVNTLATPISPATAGGASYNNRLMYGNTSATTPPVFVVAPPAPATVEVLAFTFNGTCTDKLYLEDRTEFFANGLGDPVNNYIPFRVKRSSSLPVEYTSMSAKAVNNVQVEVNWTTSQELNSDYFEVEKSFNADFAQSEVIAKLDAAGYSDNETTYSFTDRGAMAPVVYYRLRQVDLDGQVDVSNSMVVNFGESSTFGLVAYPNPFDNQVTVKVDKGSMQTYSLRVMDITGKVLYSAVSEANNATQDSWKLELGFLSRGTYFIQVAELGGEGRQGVFKLMK